MSRCTGALGRRNIYGTVLAYTQQSLSIKGGGQSALRQEHASINPEVLHEPDTAVQQAAHETRLPALRIASLALTDAAPRAVARLFPPMTFIGSENNRFSESPKNAAHFFGL